KAHRVSASRFFWSRPVIAGFNDGVPGYGAAGVLEDLTRRPPAIIALQQVDWLGDVDSPAHYFTTPPLLGPWLRDNYAAGGGSGGLRSVDPAGDPVSGSREGMRSRTFVTALVGLVALGAVLRAMFPAADPPWRTSVGVVWHDEGPWVHNARNKALFGVWSLDKWNPMYIAPVFTGLEYLSFEAFGVGVRQARVVPAATGIVSVLLLSLGIGRLAGRHAALAAAALLATNYVYAMWNRAALMEGPMSAFMRVAGYCAVRAGTSPPRCVCAGLPGVG